MSRSVFRQSDSDLGRSITRFAPDWHLDLLEVNTIPSISSTRSFDPMVPSRTIRSNCETVKPDSPGWLRPDCPRGQDSRADAPAGHQFRKERRLKMSKLFVPPASPLRRV